MQRLPAKQLLTVIILVLLVAGGLAAVRAPKDGFKNLKILPSDISQSKLDSIMESYNKALGVSCNFCHSAVANFPDSLDFAADENKMKENARDMMRMNIYINKTWFYFDKTERPEYLKVVNCMTCHHGEAYPVHP
jgi:hypothetical protein